MTLPEVIEGLKQGRSYIREDTSGRDTLRPVGEGRVEHVYVSAYSGFGGVAEVSFDTLLNGHWPADCWDVLN